MYIQSQTKNTTDTLYNKTLSCLYVHVTSMDCKEAYIPIPFPFHIKRGYNGNFIFKTRMGIAQTYHLVRAQ
jgi:hypothetical protein